MRNGSLAVGLLVLGLTGTAPAALITFNGVAVDQAGTGHGNVLNVLTVQNDPSEFGSILLNPSNGHDVTAGDAKSQSQTQVVSDLTTASINASDFGIVFNIVQSGGSPVGLNAFTFRFYTNPSDLTQFFDAPFTPGGSNASTSSLAPPNHNGTGNAGWLFNVSFTPTEATAFFGNAGNKVGAFITSGNAITGSNAGAENFYITDVNNLVAVPEPDTARLMLLGLPLTVFGLVMRYRRTHARRPSLSRLIHSFQPRN